jgi:hypothetical protein
MANSGSKKVTVTSWDSLEFRWGIKSQSVESNFSQVDWSLLLISTSSGRIDSSVEKSWSVTINGKTYSGKNTINIANNTEKRLAYGSTVIPHNSNGTKEFSYSFSQAFDITFSGSSIGTISGSGTGILDTIARLSTLTVPSNGVLGSALTLTVTKQSSSNKHLINAKCGTAASVNVAANSSETSITFTPPLSFASQNTTGNKVTVDYTIHTVVEKDSGLVQIGGNVVSAKHSIPDSVKPSCSLSVSDTTGIYDRYGAYLRGLSKLSVSITPNTSNCYGATIKAYSCTANGATYSKASFTTAVLKSAGSQSISATVTDTRGRTGTATQNISVLDYSAPKITRLAVHRCNEDGTENNKGEYVKVTFSAAVSSIQNKNTAKYELSCKKSSETTYNTVELTDLANAYTVTDSSYVFAADTGSSYDVKLTVTDNHSVESKATSASTAFTLIHFGASGTGMGIGKLCENDNLLDIGLQTRFFGGLLPVVLEANTDLNNVLTPNTYTGANLSTNKYANCPVSNGTFTLLVESCGEEGQIKQTYTACSKYKPERYSRFYYQGAWGEWFWASTDEVVLYEDSNGSAGVITLLYAAGHYKYIEIYYTDNNNKRGGYTKVWQPDGKNVCLHIQEAGDTIYSRQTMYSISGTTMTPQGDTASFVKISGTTSSVTKNGTNYIKVIRVIGRA